MCWHIHVVLLLYEYHEKPQQKISCEKCQISCMFDVFFYVADANKACIYKEQRASKSPSNSLWVDVVQNPDFCIKQKCILVALTNRLTRALLVKLPTKLQNPKYQTYSKLL